MKDVFKAGSTIHTRCGYDASSNRTSIVDANTHTTDFQYNEQNLVKKITDPLAKTTDFTYDGALNLKTKKDRSVRKLIS